MKPIERNNGKKVLVFDIDADTGPSVSAPLSWFSALQSRFPFLFPKGVPSPSIESGPTSEAASVSSLDSSVSSSVGVASLVGTGFGFF